MDPGIVYYHGCVVDYFDHETGRAVIDLLEMTGHTVEVPDLICCSFPLLSSGQIALARKRAVRLVSSLVKYVARGHSIICSCPTCGYALKEAYPKLLSSESADLVAANTHFVSTYLLKLYNDGEQRIPFRQRSLRLGYHAPCHLRAQDLSTSAVDLLSLIPGTEVLHLDRGCCGMGGTWGLRSKRRSDLSMGIGSPLFEAIREAQLQLVATDCFGCQLQISRFTRCAVTHPMQILVEAHV